MRFVVMAAVAAVALSGCASVDLTPHSGYAVEATVLEYKGVTLRAGDHVAIKSRAGTFKPKDTGNSIDVIAEPPRTGMLLGVVKDMTQVLLIRFDEQVWRDTSSSNAEVTLKPFEASIHADYVEVVK